MTMRRRSLFLVGFIPIVTLYFDLILRTPW